MKFRFLLVEPDLRKCLDWAASQGPDDARSDGSGKHSSSACDVGSGSGWETLERVADPADPDEG